MFRPPVFRVLRLTSVSQCGHPVCPEIQKFKAIDPIEFEGSKEKVIQASAGLTFTLVLTEGGRGTHRFPNVMYQQCSLQYNIIVYAFGSAEKGQLGNGKTGAHIVQAGKVVFDAESEPCKYFNVVPLSLQISYPLKCLSRDLKERR